MDCVLCSIFFCFLHNVCSIGFFFLFKNSACFFPALIVFHFVFSVPRYFIFLDLPRTSADASFIVSYILLHIVFIEPVLSIFRSFQRLCISYLKRLQHSASLNLVMSYHLLTIVSCVVIFLFSSTLIFTQTK